MESRTGIPMSQTISVAVNGVTATTVVDDRLTLVDYLRGCRHLTGTRVGCEQGACGTCTVLLGGRVVRSCLILAAQADGCSVLTVEGLAQMSPAGLALQQAFARHDAVQCGYCTSGFLVTALDLLGLAELDESIVRQSLSGNLCRCTGYAGIVAAVLDVHQQLGPVAPPRLAPLGNPGRERVSDPPGRRSGERRMPPRSRAEMRWVARTGVAVLAALAVAVAWTVRQYRHRSGPEVSTR